MPPDPNPSPAGDDKEGAAKLASSVPTKLAFFLTLLLAAFCFLSRVSAHPTLGS
jgi:hypothetical protein